MASIEYNPLEELVPGKMIPTNQMQQLQGFSGGIGSASSGLDDLRRIIASVNTAEHTSLQYESPIPARNYKLIITKKFFRINRLVNIEVGGLLPDDPIDKLRMEVYDWIYN